MKKFISKVVLVLALFTFTACSTGSSGIQTPPSATSDVADERFAQLEIRDYEGTRLDPSAGLRENSIKGVQNVDISKYELKISGLVEQQLALGYEDVLGMQSYEKLITLYCVEGWDVTILWKGTRISDILSNVKVLDAANTVIFHAVDGYTTSLPLEQVLSKQMLLAYSSNGITIPASLGYPFIVVAEDKLGYKWARWVNEIELSDDPSYKGYWEERGYDNEAELPH